MQQKTETMAAAESSDDSHEKEAKIHRQTQEQHTWRISMFVLLTIAFLVCVVYPEVSARNQERMIEEQLLLRRSEEEMQQKQAAIELAKKEEQHHHIQDLTAKFDEQVEVVRSIKKTGVIMETDPKSLEETKRLQEAARALCKAKYGALEPYRIRVEMEFQDQETGTDARHGVVVIETAPLDLIPYSVYNFLEVARGYKTGGFHRRAGHVLQVTVNSDYAKQSLAFQEYSEQFPHVKGTVGYCGRPSGGRGCWYISTINNSRNHGPGSQQQKNPYEADANFGKIIEGFEEMVPRIRSSMKRDGFLNDKKDWVLINSMQILIPDGKGGYVPFEE